MDLTFSLPIDRFQRELADEALHRAGAPFDPSRSDDFRRNVSRVWGYYQALAAKEDERGVGLMHHVDRLLYQRKRQEYCDDPAIPVPRRERLIGHLARLNRRLQSYRWFFMALEEFVKPLPPGEISVLDIGSGHGEFPIALARRGSLAGHPLRVVGSDIDAAYVEKGRANARAQGVDIAFRQVDALRLADEQERFDIITSTQTVHHFEPAFLAELMYHARTNARKGMVLFDARRSLLNVAGVAAAATLVGRGDWWFVHDGVVSVRRMYSPAEFELLARCAPGGESVRACNLSFGFVAVESA